MGENRALLIFLALALVAAAGYLVVGPYGLLHLLNLRGEARAIEAQAAALAEENRLLRVEIERLRTDDETIEQVIRDELGFVRPDELVYAFPAAPALRP